MVNRITKIEMLESDKLILEFGTYIVSNNDITTIENYFVRNTKFKIIDIVHQKYNGYSKVHDAFVEDELIIKLSGPNGELWITYESNSFWEKFHLLKHGNKRITLFGYTIDIYKSNPLNKSN